MTTHEAHERILELDDMIFKADTGQIRVTWEQYTCLKIETQALMDALAKSIATYGKCTYEEAFAERERLRSVNLLSAIMQLHCELNPEDAKRDDPLLVKALHSGPNGDEIDYEAFERFMVQFSYLLENAPKPPVEPAKKPSLMQRLLGRK
jgi:hypothetical protein